MSDQKTPKADFNMQLYRMLGEKLVSRNAALCFAEQIIRDRYGQDELHRQSPLEIVEDTDMWIISGCIDPELPPEVPSGRLLKGRISIVISQFDGQILNLSQDGAIAR